MKKSNTAERLREIMQTRNLRQVDILRLCAPYSTATERLTKSDLSQYVNGVTTPGQFKLTILANGLGVDEAWLMGYDKLDLRAPQISPETITFRLIGDIAAGYNALGVEDWSGETVEIPVSYLKGRSKDDFLVLRVKGDSMYPLYQNGDKVLILKQDALPESGTICAVFYNDENATLKKVEPQPDKLRLVPVNPMYQPEEITGEALRHFRVLGLPKYLIREITE